MTIRIVNGRQTPNLWKLREWKSYIYIFENHKIQVNKKKHIYMLNGERKPLTNKFNIR